MAEKAEQPGNVPVEEPAWKRRAVERSTQAAKRRAEERVERFLEAAREVVAERGTTDFTVQQVVDRSGQSLRSFYQHFDGKHALLLALFEDAMSTTAGRLRAGAGERVPPGERLRHAVRGLFDTCRPGTRGPLFVDVAPGLLVAHPREMGVAVAPLLALFTDLLTELGRAGALRPGVEPGRGAALLVRTVMSGAQSGGAAPEEPPFTADEVWDFCAHGLLVDV